MTTNSLHVSPVSLTHTHTHTQLSCWHTVSCSHSDITVTSQWHQLSAVTHTGTGCFQTWGRCRSGLRWRRWSDRSRWAARRPDPWPSPTAWTPSGAPGRSSSSWWSHLTDAGGPGHHGNRYKLSQHLHADGDRALTGVGVDVKPGGHAVSVHDAVFHLSVDSHVGVVGLNAQDKRPRGLVLQNHCVQTVVLTLRAERARSEPSG